MQYFAARELVRLAVVEGASKKRTATFEIFDLYPTHGRENRTARTLRSCLGAQSNRDDSGTTRDSVRKFGYFSDDAEDAFKWEVCESARSKAASAYEERLVLLKDGRTPLNQMEFKTYDGDAHAFALEKFDEGIPAWLAGTSHASEALADLLSDLEQRRAALSS